MNLTFEQTTRALFWNRLCGAALMASCALSAEAATYWAAADGADDASGLDATAPTTLPHAIAQATDGDTVKVLAGTYTVEATANNDTPWITIEHAVTVESVDGPATTVLDGGNVSFRFPMTIANAGATVSGLSFTHVKSNTMWNKYLGGVIHNAAGGTITNCVFSDCSANYSGAVQMNGGKLLDCQFIRCTTTDSNSYGAGTLLYNGAPLVERCLFDGCTAKQGSGIYIHSAASGAIVRDCRIVNCTGQATTRGYTGALTMLAGLVERCLIATNTMTCGTSATYPSAGGAQVRGGTLRNCLVTHNTARNGVEGSYAGGIYQTGGVVENCTVVGNALNAQDFVGQGAYVNAPAAILRNTIVAFNGGYGVFDDPANFKCAAGTVEHCCTYPLAAGTGNTDEDPLFSSDGPEGMLFGPSTCVNGGLDQPWMADATDFYGNPRLNQTVDIGCHEIDPSTLPFSCLISRTPPQGALPLTVTFTASIVGAPGAVTEVAWDFGDGSTLSGTALTVEHDYTEAGLYTVSLSVTAGGQTCSASMADSVNVTRQISKTYVATDGGNVWPYDTPEKAARNLADAVNALTFETVDSVGSVEVAPGRYTIPETPFDGWNVNVPWVKVDHAVRIYSSDGPDVTIFDGGWTGGTSPVRYAFFLNHAKCSLEGFTIERIYSNVSYGLHESGAVHASLGTVSNCVIRNTSHFYTGPLSLRKATAWDCVITNNLTRDGDTLGGVVLEQGEAGLYNSIIGDNTGKHGSGLFLNHASSIVSNCLVYGNVCEFTSRGSYAAVSIENGLVTDCVITNNTGYCGSVYLKNNTSKLRNSLVAGNTCLSATYGGGGVCMDNGTVENCTIAGNRSLFVTAGQGLVQKNGTVRNCVIACNGADGLFEDVNNCAKTGGTMEYSCVYPEIAGTSNLFANPKFAAANMGDYTLTLVSPLLNQGLSQPWMATARDLRGYARVIGDRPEPGCYEIDPSQVPFSCDVTVTSGQLGLAPFTASFTGAAINPPDAVTAYEWDFGDGTTGTGETIPHTYETAGRFTVTLTVRCGGVSTQKVLVDLISAGCDEAYVSPTGTAVWPYSTAKTAATNIQDAIDAILLPNASARGTVHVLPGVYKLTKGGTEKLAADVTLSRPIAVISTDGAEQTILDGANQSFVRAVVMTSPGAALDGFTLCNCKSSLSDKGQAGVVDMTAGTLSNCIVTNNSGTWSAVIGVKGGRVEKCLFAGNATSDTAAEGGAVRLAGNGIVADSVFGPGNVSVYGPAAYIVGENAVMSNCTVTGTTIANPYRGVGGAPVELVRGLLTHCVITGNTGRVAGGVTTWNGYSAVKNASPIVRNCLIAGNTALGYNGTTEGAGGVYHGAGSVENCTIVFNTAATDGVCGDMMALAQSTGTPYRLVNTIVYGSEAASVYAPTLEEATNCKADPKFRHPERGDYWTLSGSPTRNAGTTLDWMTNAATDLNGNPRLQNHIVDIGCLECADIGFLILIR